MELADIYSRLQDEESRNIFKIKQLFQENQDKLAFAIAMLKLHPDMYFNEVEDFITRANVKRLCIFGESENDDYMYQVLLNAGFDVCKAKNVDVVKNVRQQGYIVFNEVLIDALEESGIESDKILYSRRAFTGRIGWQYFDVFSPKENEYFVDVGGYSGETSSDFIKWCGGKYKAIDIFEPTPVMIEKCKERIERSNLANTTLYPLAISDKKGIEKYIINNNFFYTARLDENGEHFVQTDTLDNIVQDKRISFIKIDVEGAESKVIKGAINTIRNNKPRMAISVYHKIDDYYTIAEELLNICPSYKFKLRHYHTDVIETILYAY